MKEWKAPEKEAQKMTRNGAVSVNLVTGETTYPSDRTPEQDYSTSGDAVGTAGKVVDRVELNREQAAAKRSAGNSAGPIGRARRRRPPILPIAVFRGGPGQAGTARGHPKVGQGGGAAGCRQGRGPQ